MESPIDINMIRFSRVDGAYMDVGCSDCESKPASSVHALNIQKNRSIPNGTRIYRAVSFSTFCRTEHLTLQLQAAREEDPVADVDREATPHEQHVHGGEPSALGRQRLLPALPPDDALPRVVAVLLEAVSSVGVVAALALVVDGDDGGGENLDDG